MEFIFIFYTNYNFGVDNLLTYSPWLQKEEELQQFLDSYKTKFTIRGILSLSTTAAIEVALAQVNECNEEKDISQVFLLGGALPNSKKNIKEMRAANDNDGLYNRARSMLFTNKKFSLTKKFRKACYYETEMEKLK